MKLKLFEIYTKYIRFVQEVAKHLITFMDGGS